MRRSLLVLTLATFLGAACGGGGTLPDAADAPAADAPAADAPAADAPAADAPAADAPVATTVTRFVDACASAGTGSERCLYRFELPASCPAGGCNQLALFFSGGEENCPADAYRRVLDAYAQDGTVAVCLEPFETGQAAGDFPYAAEAGRVDALVRAVRADPDVAAAWNGKRLLWSGVSHGATGPVDAMARTNLDDAAEWKGSELTAACFFDGIYDIAAFDALLGTGGQNGNPCLLPVSHARAVGRYYTSAPLGHSCSNGKCACDPSHSPAMDNDTITSVPASAFAITTWKLIECGSALDACTGDIAPAAPIETLCTTLNGDGHTCAFESMPSDSHLVCALANVGAARCRTWFDAL